MTDSNQSKALTYDDVEDEIDDGEESDGGTALRNVLEEEARHGTRHGPVNKSIAWFHPAVAIVVDREKKWKFVCKHCGW